MASAWLTLKMKLPSEDLRSQLEMGDFSNFNFFILLTFDLSDFYTYVSS